MIERTREGVFVISANQVWRPGVFETERAARMGQRRLDEEIRELQVAADLSGSCVITEALIRATPRWPKAPVKDCDDCGEALYANGRYFDRVEVDGVPRYLHRLCAERRGFRR